ncbi:MAG: CoA transferase [Dehalococcoidia bacterium]
MAMARAKLPDYPFAVVLAHPISRDTDAGTAGKGGTAVRQCAAMLLERGPARGGQEAKDNGGMAAGALPLSGVRVIDFTNAVAGPTASFILGDMGAEVIKIDRPPPAAARPRVAAARAAIPDRPWNRLHQFNELNRSKLGVVLDVAGPGGRARPSSNWRRSRISWSRTLRRGWWGTSASTTRTWRGCGLTSSTSRCLPSARPAPTATVSPMAPVSTP